MRLNETVFFRKLFQMLHAWKLSDPKNMPIWCFRSIHVFVSFFGSFCAWNPSELLRSGGGQRRWHRCGQQQAEGPGGRAGLGWGHQPSGGGSAGDGPAEGVQRDGRRPTVKGGDWISWEWLQMFFGETSGDFKRAGRTSTMILASCIGCKMRKTHRLFKKKQLQTSWDLVSVSGKNGQKTRLAMRVWWIALSRKQRTAPFFQWVLITTTRKGAENP